MKIFATNIFNNKNTICPEHRKNLYSTNCLERQPQIDVVSFGANTPKFKKTLYRAISIDELIVLLSGESAGSYKYATTSPMGYGATNWANGFASRKKDTFFIKFKDNNFRDIDVMDRCDNEKDTRYVITKTINLDDVHSIYKGHNVNGEMIWAQDESLMDLDRDKKLLRIQQIYEELENINANIDELIAELGSFAKQFPDIVSTLMKNKKITLSQKELSFLMYKSENPQYYTYIKDLMKMSLKESDPSKIDEFAIKYMENFAQKEDLDLVLEIFEKDPEKTQHDYSKLISNIVDENDVPKLEKIFQKSDYSTKETLLYTFKALDSTYITQNKAFELCEKLLNELKGFKTEDYKQDKSLFDLLFACVNILDVENNYLKLKPELVKKFCDLDLGTDPDFRFYLTELSK